MDNRFDLYETQLNILEKCPEWGELMRVIAFKNIPEADPAGYGDKTIYYNRGKMRLLPPAEQEYMIAQQLMHIQLAHRQRGRGRNRQIWEEACNAVINELLVDDGFEPPAFIRQLQEARGLSAEEMYDILYARAEDDETQPKDLSEEESGDQTEAMEMLLQIKKKVPDKQQGDLQGAQNRDIEDPGLARAVAGLADLMEPSMQLDYDWFPADRIRDGILMEQFRPYPVPHAEILLDTSASIDTELLKAFVRGVRELLSEDAVVKVGCFDTEFYGFQEINSEQDISKLEIKGAGGTNFETAVNAFTGDAETKIIFTDGYAEMPSRRCDAIWLVYSDTPVNPPGGRVIYVKKPEETVKYEVDFLIT